MERLICLLMFLGCSTGALGGQSACITGFTNNINNPRARKIPYEERRIIPGINFNCSGVIAAWTIRAKWRTDGMHTSFPHLQIWRKHGSDSTYFIARDTELFVSNGSSRSEGDYIFTGTLEPPLKFRAGDVLGMFQPPASRSRVGVYYASGRSPNYYIETGSAHQPPLASVIATGLSSNKIENGLPLVSVNAAPDATIMTSANSIAIVEKPYSISCRINTADSLNFMFNITWIAQNSSVVATLIGSGNILAHNFTASLNDAGPYVCEASVTSPDLDTPRFLSSTVNITVKIPTPTLTMTRYPDARVTLRHGDPLTLTCTIQLDPAVNSDVVVTGTLNGPGGSASNPIKVSDRTYQIILMISSTRSSTYTCTATTSPGLGDVNFVASEEGVSTLDITVEFIVSIMISYTPPPDVVLGPNEYRAASGPVTVHCTVMGGTGTINYQWSSTCRDCPFQSSTSSVIIRGAVHSGDIGIHTCTVANQYQSSSASINFNVVGAGIHVFNGIPIGSLPNNGLVSLVPVAKNFRLRFFCRSDSMMENVGLLIGPDGCVNDSFLEVANPQPGELTVLNTIDTSSDLINSQQGVHTCRIPLQNGETKEINIGIYPSGFRTPPRITKFVFIPGSSSSTLICTSTGSPATTVSWMRDGQQLTIDGNAYQMTQIVTNRTASTYDNILAIYNQLPSIIQHQYVCSISNMMGTSSSVLSLTVPIINIMQRGEPIAGKPFSLRCKVVVVNTSQEIGIPIIEFSGPPDIYSDDDANVEMVDSSVTYTHTVHFDTLQVSHGGNYICQANFSLLTVTDEMTLFVKIPTPILSMIRNPDTSVTLYHGDSLNLTCNIQLDTAVDYDVQVVGSLSGQGIRYPSGTVIRISERMYQINKSIESLKAEKYAAYTCIATVRPGPAVMNVVASKLNCSRLDIIVELAVNITVLYTPPPGFIPGPQEYRAASGPVQVTCTAVGGSGILSYRWSSTCRDCPFQSSKPNSTLRLIVRGAAHSGDTGIHTCSVIDGAGNTGSGKIKFNVIGAGIHVFNGLQRGSPPNNGLAVADDSDPRFRIRAFCRSNSMMNNVGELIGPEGNIIRTSDPFDISHPQPGELVAIVFPNTTLTHRHQGVYTCRIPLASRVVNDINIGFYPSGFMTNPTITSVIFSTESSSSTLTCTSTGSPATNVTWTMKNALNLTMRHGDSINVNMINYQLVQTVISRRNSTYSNKLIINTTSVGDITGYRCEVTNVLGRNRKGIELGVTILAADAARLGEDYTLTCTVSGISNISISFEWLGPGIARRTGHPQLSLGPLALSNAGMYTCIATVSALNLNLTESEETIIAIPSPTVRVTHDGGSPIYSGSILTLTCTITLDENVVQYKNVLIVTSRWYVPHGYLMNGTEITVTSAVGSSTDGQYTSTAVLNTIRDAGTYSCQATVRHSTSRFVVDGMNTNETVIDVQAPRLLISLAPNTTRLPNVSPYNTFSLTCTATVPEGVVSPKTFTWWRKNAVMNTDLTEIHSNEAMNITYSTLEQPVNSSILTVSETTVGIWAYLCKVVLNNIENTSDAHSIYVIGPAGPNSPTYFVASTITTNAATVYLFIPFITFTPETYVVHYGTSMTAVDSISTPVESTNFTAKDIKVSIMLTALTPNTMYFYFISASNTETSVISPTETFMTQEVSSSDSTTAKITGSVAGVTLLVVLGIVVVVIVFVRKHSSRHGNHTTKHVNLHEVAKEEEPGSQTVECVAYHQVKHRHSIEPIGTEHSESVEHPKATESPVYENVSRKRQSPATDSPAENVYEVMVSV